MKTIIIASLLAFTVGSALAAEFKLGSLVIENPWARETPKGTTVGGAYLTIENNGTTPDRLVGGSVSVAKLLQIHNMTMENGVAKMREVTGGVEIVRVRPPDLHRDHRT